MTQDTAIKAIVFDFGGVIFARSETERFAYWGEQIGIDPELVSNAWRTCSPDLERGEITMPEFWRNIERALGRKIHPTIRPKLWGHPLATHAPVRMELLALADRLRANGYQLGVLSNIYVSHTVAREPNPVFDHFDVVCLSSEIGAVKPEPEAYYILLEKLGVTGDECVFIDDLSRNVDGAKAVGIQGIVFQSSQQIMEDLAQLGVNTA